MADDELTNNYYTRIYDYQPRTKAQGEHVRGDFTGVEDGFRKLPPHNGKKTGFDESFVVKNPTGPYSPLPYHLHRIWGEEIDANGHALKGLPNADPKQKDHAASVEYVHDAITRANDPSVHPGDAIAWTHIAEEGEKVIKPPFQFYSCAVYIQGVYQDPYSAYTLAGDTPESKTKHTIKLNGRLSKGEKVVVLMGMNAPSTGSTLVYKQPLSICINYATPVDGEYVYCNMKMPLRAVFPAKMPDGSALSATPPKAIYTINIYKNDALVGFVSWLAGSTEGTFSFENEVVYEKNDVLKVQSQIVPENEISGIGLVLHGWREAKEMR